MINNRFKTTGIAFKLSLSIFSCTSLLIFIILFYNYNLSKKLLQESARETAEQLSNATVSHIENIFGSVQKAPEGISLYLQTSEIKEANLFELLSFTLQNKPEIFGTCAAFAPNAFYPEVERYAPYCSRSPDGFSFKNLGTDEHRYFSRAGTPCQRKVANHNGQNHILMKEGEIS